MTRIYIALAALCGAAVPLLLDSALKSAVLLTLAGIAALVLRKGSAATRHFLWLLTLAALLALPLLSALLPGWRALPRWTSMAETAAVSPTRMALPSITPYQPPAAAPRLVESAPEQPFVTQTVPAGLTTPRNWLALVWISGVVLLVIRLLAAHWSLLRTTRKCSAAAAERLVQALEAARRQLEIRQPVQVLLDSRRTIPMVWGLFRARLLLPAEAVGWTDSQLRSVLFHELAHVKRHDVAAQWLMQAACILYWFNPLVWLAAWRMHAEAECACDNLVLASGVRGSDYAEHLLHIAARFSAACPAACGLAMARPSRLEGRLLAVLSDRLNRRGIARVPMLVALGLGLCVVVPVAMLSAADEKQDPPPAQQEESLATTPAGEVPSLDGQAEVQDKQEVQRIQLQQAERDLARASDLYRQGQISKAEYEKAQYNVKVRRAELLGNPADAARVQLDQAEADLARVNELRAVNAVSALELDQARLEVERLRAESATDPAEKARAQLVFAKAVLATAQANLKRISELAEQHAVSEAEREQAAAAVAVAEAKLRISEAQFKQSNVTEHSAESVVSTVNPDPFAVETARAELDVARTDADIARARLKRVAESVQNNVAPQSELGIPKAEVAKAEAVLRLAEIRYKRLTGSNQEQGEMTPPVKR